MECQRTRDLLIERQYGGLQVGAEEGLTSHLEGCEACRIEAASLEELVRTLDRWRAPDAPAGLASRAIERCFQASRHPSPGEPDTSRIFAYLGLGLVAAALSMILVAGSVPRLSIPALSVGLIGAIWAVMYGAAFAQALQRELRIQTIARIALLGSGLVILAAPILSIPSVVEACRQLFVEAQGSFGLNLLLFVIGAFYTGIPVFASATLWGRSLEGTDAVQGGGRAGLLFLLLVAPAVYIQCAAMALGVVATWMAGALIGAVAGPTAGIWAVTRLAWRQA